MRDHFFMRHEVPYLTVIVSYNLHAVEQPKNNAKKERDESWKELLKPEDMPLFNAMRDWRNETSRRQAKRQHNKKVFSRVQAASRASRQLATRPERVVSDLHKFLGRFNVLANGLSR